MVGPCRTRQGPWGWVSIGVVVPGLEVVGELGRGAGSVVYRARRRGDEFALKQQVLTEQGRWLNAQEYLWAAYGLCTSLTFCGYPQQSLTWYERARAQVDDEGPSRPGYGPDPVDPGACDPAHSGFDHGSPARPAAPGFARSAVMDRGPADRPGRNGRAAAAHLEGIAIRLRSTIGTGDLIARYGGEEFAAFVVTPGTDADHLAERLRSTIAATPMTTAAGPVHLTISIGVAHADPDCPDLGTLLARADDALYQAKRDGRNRVATTPRG